MTAQHDRGPGARDHIPPRAAALHDLDAYLELPRVSGLAVSRDGSRAALVVSQLDEKAEQPQILGLERPAGSL